MSASLKTVPLAKPIETPAGPITKFVVREPTFEDVLREGEPYSVSRSPDGIPLIVEHAEVISAYIGLCLVEPPRLVLAQGGVATARAVKEAVLAYFFPEPLPDGGSTTLPTNSSSEASAASATSSG